MSGKCDPPKHSQFSSTNQPPNESKRVPKLKTRLKHLLANNYDEVASALMKNAKKGDIKTIEFMRDWLYGKPKEHYDTNNKIDIKVEYVHNKNK